MYCLSRLSLYIFYFWRVFVWIAAGVILLGAGNVRAAEPAGSFAESEAVTGKSAWMFGHGAEPVWSELASGLEIACFPARDPAGNTLEMVILRIDPRRFIFSVHTATGEGEALSLGAWADRHKLSAAINASMYLPDGRTSTGYLRVGEHLNNGRIAGRFGAFFVSDPHTPFPEEPSPTKGSGNAAEAGSARSSDGDLPEAALLDRACDTWEALLPRYRNVVQNYRLISADRRLLWNPGGPKHAISAVGSDGNGNILFIHCREPLTGIDFGAWLLALPIDVRLVMYTEGGSQAGLLVRSGSVHRIWMGRHPADLWTAGNPSAPLPNVIGIRPKSSQQ